MMTQNSDTPTNGKQNSAPPETSIPFRPELEMISSHPELYHFLADKLSEKGWSDRQKLYSHYLTGVEIRPASKQPNASVVVISWKANPDTAAALAKLRSERGLGFELVFVNNGADPGSFEDLREDIDTLVHLNDNTGAYLARNLGAVFSRSPILIFLDDDGLPWDRFIGGHLEAHNTYDVHAVRGVVWPKTSNPLNDLAKHYYLGEVPFPIFADVEGNVSYNAETFFTIGGWDDEIRFGGGGLELALRLLSHDPDMRRQMYSPVPRIYHDYAKDQTHLEQKWIKQTKSRERLQRKYPGYQNVIEAFRQFRGRPDVLMVRERQKVEV